MTLKEELHSPYSPLPWRLCRNEGEAIFVILNEVKNLIESTSQKTEILRLTPQNDITTQSLDGRGWGPAPRWIQDHALNLTWFRGEGE